MMACLWGNSFVDMHTALGMAGCAPEESIALTLSMFPSFEAMCKAVFPSYTQKQKDTHCG